MLDLECIDTRRWLVTHGGPSGVKSQATDDGGLSHHPAVGQLMFRRLKPSGCDTGNHGKINLRFFMT